MTTWITLPWPEWVCTEEGDIAWIRHDADYPVVEEMRSCLVTGVDHVMRAVEKVAMVQSDFDGRPDAPRLSETDDPNAADAVLYTRFESEWTWPA
jgi:hypothetical protein